MLGLNVAVVFERSRIFRDQVDLQLEEASSYSADTSGRDQS